VQQKYITELSIKDIENWFYFFTGGPWLDVGRVNLIDESHDLVASTGCYPK
jgi:hypothetical protein